MQPWNKDSANTTKNAQSTEGIALLITITKHGPLKMRQLTETTETPDRQGRAERTPRQPVCGQALVCHRHRVGDKQYTDSNRQTQHVQAGLTLVWDRLEICSKLLEPPGNSTMAPKSISLITLTMCTEPSCSHSSSFHLHRHVSNRACCQETTYFL